MSRDQAYRQGRRRLKALLPKARADLRNSHDIRSTQSRSLIGQSVIDHIELRNLDSLMIYQDGPGRWYADLVFKNLPLGVPNTMGTPVKHPRESESAALREGYSLLLSILSSIDEKNQATRDMPPISTSTRYFELYDYSFSIPANAVDAVGDLQALMGDAYGADDALAYFETALGDLCGTDTFSGELLDGAPEDKRLRLYAGMGLLLNFRIFRYPEPCSAQKRT